MDPIEYVIAKNFTPDAEARNHAERTRELEELGLGAVAPSRPQGGRSSDHTQSIKRECDYCGAPGARLQCSRCRSVHYCGAACQKLDWKQGPACGGTPHKQACSTLKAALTEMAPRVLAQMRGAGGESMRERIKLLAEDYVLDGGGAYDAALAAGLHSTILACMLVDADEAAVLARFRGGYATIPQQTSVTQHITCTLFRGKRRKGGPRGATSQADGHRVSSFILSDQGAWIVWLRAAAALASAGTDAQVASGPPDAHRWAHSCARNLLAGLVLCLARPEVGPAVLCFSTKGFERGGGGEGYERACARARQSLAVLQAALDPIWDEDERDPRNVVSQYLTCIVAMLDSWCRRLHVGVNLGAALRLQGRSCKAYKLLSVPLAEAYIDKGRNLTADDTAAALRGSRK